MRDKIEGTFLALGVFGAVLFVISPLICKGCGMSATLGSVPVAALPIASALVFVGFISLHIFAQWLRPARE